MFDFIRYEDSHVSVRVIFFLMSLFNTKRTVSRPADRDKIAAKSRIMYRRKKDDNAGDLNEQERGKPGQVNDVSSDIVVYFILKLIIRAFRRLNR